MELRNELITAFGVEVPATVTFDYPSVAALTAYIVDSTAAEQAVPGEDVRAAAVSVHLTGSQGGLPAATAMWSVAQRGAAGQPAHVTPGTALGSGVADLVTPVPLDRWDADALTLPPEIAAATGLRFGAWVADVGAFDGSVFRLSRQECLGLDPQCRLLLEETLQAVVHAGGVTPEEPPRTAVFVGSVWTEYAVLQDRLSVPETVAALTGSGLNFTSGRVSYTFGFQGGCPGACAWSFGVGEFGRSARWFGLKICRPGSLASQRDPSGLMHAGGGGPDTRHGGPVDGVRADCRVRPPLLPRAQVHALGWTRPALPPWWRCT